MIDTNTVREAATKPRPAAWVKTLRAMAVWALQRMFKPQERLFAFRLRREDGEDLLEGTSGRYTAVALLGLAAEDVDRTREVLHGSDPQEVCGRLLQHIESSDELGEVALSAWAAAALGHPGIGTALDHLRRLDPAGASFPTVEVAWSLSALVAVGGEGLDVPLARRIARRLIESFSERTGLFPHWPVGAKSSFLRRHVACFADFVYPIQALSLFGRAMKDGRAIDVACRSADRMCALQGEAGQWWWHFDVRNGKVIEQYPVYAVHQDAMAPMALFALREACGVDCSSAVDRGLRWLMDPPESETTLVDKPSGIIWRKVARYEPGKLVRGLQAAASRLHPGVRAPGLELLFPPGKIDYETRPYHMGWILHAWSPLRRPWGSRHE